ncbi:uncharacterized protein HaLaN_15995, partial [Haematococcus lacustris]
MIRVRELSATGLREGLVTVLSRHTTTAVTINEFEPRLLDDVRQFVRKLAPPQDPYLHNDLHLRAAPPDWPGGHAAWAAQEPVNAHSHLLSMVLGNSQSIPVVEGKLALGTWQAKPVQVQQLAQAAMAFVAAATLMAAPVFAEEVDPKIKGIICAGNPTAKICLKDSAK